MASMDELAAKLHHILNVVDNNERRRVEADVVSSLSNPITLTMLVHILCKSEADAATGTPAMSAGVRQLAAVLLRKKIFSLWAALDANAQAELKQLLLHQLGVEPVRTVRLAVAHIVMRLAKADAQEEGGGWPELQQAVRVAAEDPRVEMRELAMVLVYSFAEVYSEGSSFGGLAAEAVVRGVCDGELIVQQAAVKAAGMLLPALEQNSSKLLQQFLQELIPVCLRVLEEQSAVEDKASLCVAVVDVLECALEVMSVKKHSQILVALAQRLLPILMQPTTYPRVRQSVATALGNLVEAKPKMVVAQHLLEPLVQSCMALMAEDNTISMPDEAGEVEDDADDDDDDDVDMLHASTPCMLGGRLLSAIAGAVPSKTFTAVLLPFLQTATDPTNAATTDPRVKKSGMVALSCLAEGNPGYLRRRVGYVLETARLFMLDPNPIPREAAAFSLTYVCQHLQPEILTHHAELFPMLLPLLADENDAVRRRVAEALDTLCENVEEHLELYVDAILPAVLSAISCSTIPTQVKLCGVLSSMAMTRCPAFARHGVEVLELLKQPLTLSSPETTALRAQATETVGVVGSAMGKAAFEPYFPFFMNIIVENLRTNNAPLREQSFGFLANISELLGADFLPYLDDSIACALQSVEADKATYTNKHLLAGGDTSMAGALAHDDAGADDDSDAVSEDSAMEVHMRVRTADVEEKSSAVYALGVFADALGPLFTMERVQHCWDAITSLDGHYYLNVRANALTTAAKLAKASAGTTEVVRSLTENTLPQESRDLVDELVCGMLLSTIRQDDEKEVVAAACEALTLLLKFFGPQTFPNGPDEVVRVLLQLLRGKMPCQVDQEDSGDSDSDSEVGGAEKQDAASLLLDANGNNNGHMAHIIDAYLKGEAPPPLHADPAAGVADWKASLTAEMLLENLDLPGDHEDVLMDVVCEMLEAVAKAYGPSFAPYLVFIYPMLTYYASVEERPAEDVVMASGSLAAVLQALGEECRNYAEPSMHLALHIITSSEESTARANGAYLTRVLVEQCPTLFTADQGTVPLVLQALWSLVERRGDAEEVPEAVDNAISATCSLVRCVAPSVLPLDSIVPPMLLGIPMAVDKTENTNAARTVAHLLRELHDVSLRATWLPEVVAAAARLLASPAVEAAAKQQVGEAAVAFRGWHAEAWTSACATLSPEQQQLLVGLGL